MDAGVFYLIFLPMLAAVGVPWLCAHRWGEPGARIGAFAVIGVLFAIYAAVAVMAPGQGVLIIFVLVPAWFIISAVAITFRNYAVRRWPRGRPRPLP